MRAIPGIVLLLAGALVVSGCGGGGGSGGTSQNAEAAQGIYGGTASTGDTLAAFVLSDGRFWILYQNQAGVDLPSWRGFIYGHSNENGSTLVSSSATQFRFEPAAITPSALSATIQARSRLSGTLQLSGQNATFNVLYGEHPFISGISKTYVLSIAGLANGTENVYLQGNLTITSSGNISGVVTGDCAVSGSAKPRGDINVHDLSLTLSGISCPATVPLEGIAYFEAPGQPGSSTRQMTGIVTAADGHTGLLVTAIAP